MVATRVETPAHQPCERFSIMPVRNRKKRMCPELKVIALGNAGVGKTRLLASMTNSTQPSLGLDFRVKMVTVNDEIVKLQLWDTADQETHGVAALPKSYFRRARAALLVYDASNRQSFRDLAHWATHLQLVRDANEPLSVVVVANSSRSGLPVVSSLEGHALATLLGGSFVDSSRGEAPLSCLDQLVRGLSVATLWHADLQGLSSRLDVIEKLATVEKHQPLDDEEADSTTESENEDSELECELEPFGVDAALAPASTHRRDSRFFAALELGDAAASLGLVGAREGKRLALAGGCVMLCVCPLALLLLLLSSDSSDSEPVRWELLDGAMGVLRRLAGVASVV